MARRKKVLQEIALESDDESATVPPADQPTIEPTEIVTQQPVQELPLPTPPPPPAQPKRQRKPAAPSVQEQRRESLRKANEAKLRKKIEKEIADKERRRQDDERRMEQKVQQMVEMQLRRMQAASYAPPQPSLSRRAIAKNQPTLRPTKIHDEYEMEDYDLVPETELSDVEDEEDLPPPPPVSAARARVQPDPQSYQNRLFSQIFGK